MHMRGRAGESYVNPHGDKKDLAEGISMLNAPLTQRQRDDHQRWQANYATGQNAVQDREERNSKAKARAVRFAYEDETEVGRAGRSGGDGLITTLLSAVVGIFAVLAILPGAVLGAVLFIKLIGRVTESWHVLGLVTSFFVGGAAAYSLVVVVFFWLAFACRYALDYLGLGFRFCAAKLKPASDDTSLLD